MTAPAAAEWLRSAINQALASGITRREIFTMVATAPAARYGVRRNTLEVALFRGNIPRAGRIKGHG